MFRENNGEDENKLIAVFSLKSGLRMETVKQMVEELKEAEVI